MKSHKLDIKGNALDSLNEGLRRFAEAREGDVRAYKFAVLHVSHFLELLLKHAVAEQHRKLSSQRWSSPGREHRRSIQAVRKPLVEGTRKPSRVCARACCPWTVTQSVRNLSGNQ
jgi:hypothetical protein